jgi:site-specific DNA-methyltransferase (adenine-specific)
MTFKDEWTSDCGTVRLICGDCLEVLPTLGKVDAVVTDPPYIVGAISVGTLSAKSGTWADMENSAYWFSAWFVLAKKILRDTGYLVSCGNWRSIPTLIRGLSLCDWSATSCLIWDKQWIGPAYVNALRPTYELAIFAAMPNSEIKDRTVSDIFRGERWQSGNCKTTEHAAEKPVDLMQHIAGLVCVPSGTICDPFMGSGTTGVASVRTGRKFIGIEREPRYFEIAKRRISDELNRFPLLEKVESPQQMTLQGGDDEPA